MQSELGAHITDQGATRQRGGARHGPLGVAPGEGEARHRQSHFFGDVDDGVGFEAIEHGERSAGGSVDLDVGSHLDVEGPGALADKQGAVVVEGERDGAVGCSSQVSRPVGASTVEVDPCGCARKVDGAVAVVVLAIAQLVGAGEAPRGGVVTVVGGGEVAVGGFAGAEQVQGVAEAVFVGVAEPVGRVERRVRIDRTITVVVDAVAQLVGGGVHVGVRVVAVGVVGGAAFGLDASLDRGGCITEAVAIGVGKESGPVDGVVAIDGVVAVVVDAVAQLGGPREDGGIGVVAVDVVGEAVAVGIDERGARVGVGRGGRAVIVLGPRAIVASHGQRGGEGEEDEQVGAGVGHGHLAAWLRPPHRRRGGRSGGEDGVVERQHARTGACAPCGTGPAYSTPRAFRLPKTA